MKSPFARGALAALTLTSILGTPALAQSSYSYTDLGTLGGSHSQARGANEAGYVVGNSRLAGNTTFRAFLWSPVTGTMADLGTLPGAGDSFALAINQNNEVVGSAAGATESQAFLWDSASGMRDLNDLDGNGASDHPGWLLRQATAINDNRQVAGVGTHLQPDGTLGSRAFLLDLNTSTITELALEGSRWSEAFGLNNLVLPQVVGRAWVEGQPTHTGFVYQTITQPLNLLTAWDINEAGGIAGTISTGSGGRAAYRNPQGGMTDLGTLANGAGSSTPYALNQPSNGAPTTVVGSSDATQSVRAFRWQVGNKKMADLNSLASGKPRKWILVRAYQVTNNGRIVGYASDGSSTHAFLLTP